MASAYTVADGKLTLSLRPAEGGWYAVSCPYDPQLLTQAKSVEDAFAMAYDAQKALKEARVKLARRPSSAAPAGPNATKTLPRKKA